jgi:hypothetical protein
MQNLFSTMKVNNQPPSNNHDFFSDEPKPEVSSPSKITPSNTTSAPSFDFSLSGPSQGNFATGFGFEPSAPSSKAFATSAPGSKPLEIDFFNLPSKEEPSNSAFSKKPSGEQPSPTQMENIFSG